MIARQDAIALASYRTLQSILARLGGDPGPDIDDLDGGWLADLMEIPPD